MLVICLILLLALLLDYFLGETPRFHPLVGFGHVTTIVEKRLNESQYSNSVRRILGVFAWLILVLPLPSIYFYYHQSTLLFYVLDSIILFFAIGLNSLKQHAVNVYIPLNNNDIKKARSSVSLIVSRNTSQLNASQISRATVESVLENGHDAVIASLFWFVIGGAPLVLIHRLSNTLDAMWGYKNLKYLYFGWFSAKVDDLLGWPSAKVSGILYVFVETLNMNRIKEILTNAKRQGANYKSLNGGWVMSAGASALNIKLGGTAIYDGKMIESVELGQGEAVCAEDIKRSLSLVEKSCWLFVCFIFVIWSLALLFNKGLNY